MSMAESRTPGYRLTTLHRPCSARRPSRDPTTQHPPKTGPMATGTVNRQGWDELGEGYLALPVLSALRVRDIPTGVHTFACTDRPREDA